MLLHCFARQNFPFAPQTKGKIPKKLCPEALGVSKRGRLESRGYAIGGFFIRDHLRTSHRTQYSPVFGRQPRFRTQM